MQPYRRVNVNKHYVEDLSSDEDEPCTDLTPTIWDTSQDFSPSGSQENQENRLPENTICGPSRTNSTFNNDDPVQHEGDYMDPSLPPGNYLEADASAIQDQSIKATKCRWTLNNYSEAEVSFLRRQINLIAANRHTHLTFLVFGFEIAPTTGTPHLQGYCEFKSSTFNKIRTFLGPRVSMLTCRASGEHNARYCKKDGNFEVAGKLRPGQGARSDITEVCDMIKEGKSMREIARKCPEQIVKYHQGFQKLQALLQPQRESPPWVLWFWGPSGSGKSRTAFQIAKKVGSYYYKDSTKWFDGYEQQTIVIIDDLATQSREIGQQPGLTFSFLLNLLDGYPQPIQGKGYYTDFNSPILIITTPKKPAEMFAHVSEDMFQLTRRIAHVVHFPALNPYASADAFMANIHDAPAPLAALFNPPPPAIFPMEVSPPVPSEVPVPELSDEDIDQILMEIPVDVGRPCSPPPLSRSTTTSSIYGTGMPKRPKQPKNTLL